jgi:hypothetical protein
MNTDYSPLVDATVDFMFVDFMFMVKVGLWTTPMMSDKNR